MEAHQIINGFSEIKTELIARRRLKKTHQELELWFSYENDLVFAHDSQSHSDCIIIASLERDTFKIYLMEDSHAERVVKNARASTSENHEIARELNDQYKTLGFRIPGLF